MKAQMAQSKQSFLNELWSLARIHILIQRHHRNIRCFLLKVGTDSFYDISEELYKELLHDQPELTQKQWNEIQINFLTNHSYHTNYCKIHCKAIKATHLEELKAEVEN